jgi:hypothetical protein
MRGERWLLRTGEYLVGCAARRLPTEIRDERHQEWAAELPAILHDPDTKSALWGAVRMLGYAADTFRGADQARRRLTFEHIIWIGLYISLGIFTFQNVTARPGDWASYVFLAPFVPLVALPRPTLRKAKIYLLVFGAAAVPLLVVNAPGNWFNYVVGIPSALLFLVAIWAPEPRSRRRHARD